MDWLPLARQPPAASASKKARSDAVGWLSDSPGGRLVAGNSYTHSTGLIERTVGWSWKSRRPATCTNLSPVQWKVRRCS